MREYAGVSGEDQERVCGPRIAFRSPSMCLRAFEAEKPRTLGSRSALRVRGAHADLNLVASLRMKSRGP
jgi:hypothetical protein